VFQHLFLVHFSQFDRICCDNIQRLKPVKAEVLIISSDLFQESIREGEKGQFRKKKCSLYLSVETLYMSVLLHCRTKMSAVDKVFGFTPQFAPRSCEMAVIASVRS